MQDLKEAYVSLQQKKREKGVIAKMIRDELSNRDDYKNLVEEIRVLREKKKSIESQVKADALHDMERMDDLKNEIAAQQELISDIAISQLTSGETVEIIDEELGVRLTPVFNVRFQKEEMEHAAEKAATERAASHPEREFAPISN